MSKWEMVKLSDIFTLQMGKTPSRDNPNYWNGTNKWVSIADLGKTSKYICDTKESITDRAVSETGIKATPKGTVMMSFKLSIGKTAIAIEDIYTNEAIMSFIDRKTYQFDIGYIYHLFSGKDWTIGTNKAVMGVTLNKATLSQIAIPLPPIEFQRKIAKNLDKVTHFIDLCNSILDRLDLLVKSRFVEMFGDPVQNPYKWKKEKIKSHIDLISGFPFDSSNYVEQGINICGGLIIMPQRIKWEECKHWGKVDGFEDYLLKQDDIVLALDRPWISDGFKIAMVDSENLPALLIQRTARIRAIDVNQHYLFHYFINGNFDVHCNVTGSLVPHISTKDIFTFEVMIPPIKLQEQFAAFVVQIDKSKLAVKQVLEKTETLKKALMQEFFE